MWGLSAWSVATEVLSSIIKLYLKFFLIELSMISFRLIVNLYIIPNKKVI